MSWMEVDLLEELKAERTKRISKGEEDALFEYRKLLQRDDAIEERILKNIFEPGIVQEYDLNSLDADRIFSLKEIRKMAVSYRLRFLEASLFKNEIPHQAILEIKNIQKQQGLELKDFRILAPAPMFNLQRKDRDPLLFLNLGNDNYYLIHKWGGEVNRFRKILVYPFRSFKTVLSCVVALAAFLAMLIPEAWMGASQNSGVIRVVCFFYLFIAFGSLTILYGFSRMKDFNSNLWSSRYTD